MCICRIFSFASNAIQASGAAGFSALGSQHVGLNDTPKTDTDAYGYAGPSGAEGKGGKEVSPPPADLRWGSFITGAGEFDRVGSTETGAGLQFGLRRRHRWASITVLRTTS